MLFRKGSLLAILVLALALTAIAPVFAQDKIDIPVWIAFTDARLDWAREVAAQFNEDFPQYNVTVEGYADYESIFSAASLAFEQGTQPAIKKVPGYTREQRQRAQEERQVKAMPEIDMSAGFAANVRC